MSPEGYLLTNNHVVAGADQIVVALKDGRETLQVIGSDPETDLAVLKINLKNLPSITIGRSDTLRIGDIAPGNRQPVRGGSDHHHASTGCWLEAALDARVVLEAGGLALGGQQLDVARVDIARTLCIEVVGSVLWLAAELGPERVVEYRKGRAPTG